MKNVNLLIELTVDTYRFGMSPRIKMSGWRGTPITEQWKEMGR